MVFPANCLQVLRKFLFLKKALPPINSFRDSAEFVEAFRTEIDFQPTGTTLDSGQTPRHWNQRFSEASFLEKWTLLRSDLHGPKIFFLLWPKANFCVV